MSDDEDLSLFELFRMEAEERVESLQRLLLGVQGGSGDTQVLHSLMRDAHSLKGAARIADIPVAVNLTHAMEDRLVAAEEGRALRPVEVDTLLRATDLLRLLSLVPAEDATPQWEREHAAEIDGLVAQLSSTQPVANDAVAADSVAADAVVNDSGEAEAEPATAAETVPALPPTPAESAAPTPDTAAGESSLRISAARLDRILAGASDNLVRVQAQLALCLDVKKNEERLYRALRELIAVAQGTATPEVLGAIQRVRSGQHTLHTQLAELENAAHGNELVAASLHREVLQARMRPLREIVPGWQRLVRTVSAELGKRVRLEVVGERTDVDRDILEQLRAPLEHLLRNSLDHGLETPEVRRAAGKPEEGTVRIWARHLNGRLAISLADDGAGVDFRAVRARAEQRGLVIPATAAKMSEDEVLQFLFLPGFSTRDAVSQISGRGFGLDVVQSMVHGAGGSIRIDTVLGAGTTILLTLPITRSVLRVMRVAVEDEVYALAATRLSRLASVLVDVDAAGARTVRNDDGTRVPIVPLLEALGSGAPTPLEAGRTVALFLLDTDGEEAEIAVAVDRLLEDQLVAVRRVDERLGRRSAVAGVTLTESGNPMLILDTDHLLRTAVAAQRRRWSAAAGDDHVATVLVADDSHTIRQMLRRALVRRDYRVVVAGHGAEAWALLQSQHFDLLISDVDMPEMTGIELTEHVRGNARLRPLPVVLLSYKGRDEDRRKGLEAGADMYFSKGEFEETAFLQVVTDLIGPARQPDGAAPGDEEPWSASAS